MTAEALEQTAPVATQFGKVQGTRAGSISTFLGIPFGGDTKPCRFRPAAAPAAWTDIRTCFAFGAMAPQAPINMSGRPGAAANTEFLRTIRTILRSSTAAPGPESEDCLFLNVYTPHATAARRRPVMVWLHGGAFAMGSGGNSGYDGSALCRRGDVVVVTINHRLNALGYLYLGALHDDFADSGNVGQLDIVQALRWVRDNIEAFGGDPRNVTIFGESGGGAKVGTLLAMPSAKGLFHKAIVQSGPAVMLVDKADAEEIAERTLATLAIPKADVHRLLTLEYRAVIQAASGVQLAGAGLTRRALAPVVDGRSLPAHPFKPNAPDVSLDIPLMIGTNKDEATLFAMADPDFGKMTADQVRQQFNAQLGPRGAAGFDVYRAHRPDDRPTYWATALGTDLMFRNDSIRMAERKATRRAAPVFMYRLDWEAPMLDGILRSTHGLDIPLMFDNPDTAPNLVGTGPEPKKIAAVMAQAWVNFARTGNPSQEGLAWPPYEETQRRTMIFDRNSRVVSDPDGELRAFWDSV
jgi:para-nitrobenzyl esterase